MFCFYFWNSQKPTKEPKSHNYFWPKASFSLVQIQKHIFLLLLTFGQKKERIFFHRSLPTMLPRQCPSAFPAASVPLALSARPCRGELDCKAELACRQ